MAPTLSNEDLVPEPMINLRALLATVWRKRRIWLVTGLVGLAVGGCLHLVVPRKYTAATDLYLTAPAGANPAGAMADSVALLKTEVVAQKAAAVGRLNMTPNALLSKYTGVPVSDSIMSITFSGPSQAQAVAGARAVAAAFLAVHARQSSLQTEGLVHSLRSQISSLNNEINSLNAKITSLSGATSGSQANQAADLGNQRIADESEISQLQGQVSQALVSEQLTDGTSSVLDPAAAVPVSGKKVIVSDGLSGLVAGLAVGLIAVVFGALLSDRGPDRSTVAATLGAPVELSLGRLRSPRVMRRSRLSRQLRDPSPSLRMIERRLRGHLESVPGSALAVVAVGTSEPTALAVGALALALSSERASRRRGRRRRRQASCLDPRPQYQAREHGDVPAPRRRRPTREGSCGAGRPTPDGGEATSRRCRCGSDSRLARRRVRS